MPKLVITPEQVEAIRSLWPTGARRDEIAAAVGLSVDSLIAAKRELGLPSLRRGCRGPRREWNPTPVEIAAACAEIQRGWSPEETAVRQGYPPLGEVATESARKWKIIPLAEVAAAWKR
jgi:hypothetical protein